MSNVHALTEVLRELIRQPSVVGFEHSFFRYLQRVLEERGATVTWYEGLLVAQGDDPASAYFSAHSDRHGLLCTGPDEFQYAAFVAGHRSDLLGNSVSEQLRNKVAGRFDGTALMAYEPWSGAYWGSGHVKGSRNCEYRDNLVFEVADLEHLVAGTPVAFTDRLRIEGDCYVGQLDNVLTVAALVTLFERGFAGTAFFSAGEEAGSSWRYLLEWFRRFGGSTENLIVVDTSPFPDVEGAREHDVVLRWGDANASFHPETTQGVQDICDELGLAVVFKDLYVQERNERDGQKRSLGSTELGRIVVASNGWVQGTTLQIPTAGYHTMEERAAISACEAFMGVLHRLAGV